MATVVKVGFEPTRYCYRNQLGAFAIPSPESMVWLSFYDIYEVMSKSYTKTEFVSAIKESKSIRQALIKLNLKPAGGNYQTIHSTVKKLNLDTSHFKGQGWNKGRKFAPKRDLEDYLSNKHPIKSHKLRLRLLRENIFNHICSMCNAEDWLGQPIPLELDHINGNPKIIH